MDEEEVDEGDVDERAEEELVEDWFPGGGSLISDVGGVVGW